ncbi:MAG: hypothetical protein II837_14305 [Treponema sp.]|nr:hypothetical protein [Treponema sp.]MBQ7166636.1 hypothetical protein [Treponema sp.]
MACFAVPLAEAVVVTAVRKIALRHHAGAAAGAAGEGWHESFREKLRVLEKMLYGGSFLLAIEHIYHGEVVLYPPFLTAMRDPAEIPVMLHEMATAGTGMALLVTAAWGAGCLIASRMKKNSGGKLPGLKGAF